MTSKRWPALVFVAACLLGVPLQAGAMAIANSTLDYKNLTITPSAGTLSLDGAWVLEALAHADNSIEVPNDDFSSSISPDTVTASAAVTWASANGTASASDPPALVVTGSAMSDVNIPGCGPAAAFSNSRGTLFNSFTISGTGSVAVVFSTDISGLLHAMTDACGVFATTETIFHLDVDGTPVLFSDQILSIGPNDSQTLSFSTTLTNNADPLMLDAGVSHILILEADSESSGQVQVPEPPAGLLLISGLGALGAERRRRVLLRLVA